MSLVEEHNCRRFCLRWQIEFAECFFQDHYRKYLCTHSQRIHTNHTGWLQRLAQLPATCAWWSIVSLSSSAENYHTNIIFEKDPIYLIRTNSRFQQYTHRLTGIMAICQKCTLVEHICSASDIVGKAKVPSIFMVILNTPRTLDDFITA